MTTLRAALGAVTALLTAAGVIYAVTTSSTDQPRQASLALPQAPAGEEHVVVGRVIDGDTFVLLDQRRVRVLVADSCERNTPAGPRATADARALLEGRVVTLLREPGAPDVDYYQRLLRYVALPDGRDFAETMLRENHTAVYQGRSDASRERLAAGRRADADGRDCSR